MDGILLVHLLEIFLRTFDTWFYCVLVLVRIPVGRAHYKEITSLVYFFLAKFLFVLLTNFSDFPPDFTESVPFSPSFLLVLRESNNSSILGAHILFKKVVGKKSRFWQIKLLYAENLFACSVRSILWFEMLSQSDNACASKKGRGCIFPDSNPKSYLSVVCRGEDIVPVKCSERASKVCGGHVKAHVWACRGA